MLHALVALYGIGLLAAFNPCSLPLYPAFIASWSGSGGTPTAGAAAFVAGSTVSFVGLGIAAGSIGGVLSVLDWLGRIAGASLAIAGLATLRRLALDRPGRTWSPLERRIAGDGRWIRGPVIGRSFALGAAAGLAWSPCVGPLLGSALTVAASSGSPWRAGALLAAYAIGTATPLLLVAHGAVDLAAARSVAARVARTASFAGALSMVAVGALLALDRYSAVVGRWIPASS